MKKKKEKKQTQQTPSFFQELGCFMKPYQGKYTVSVILSLLGVLCSIGAYAFAGAVAAMLFCPEPRGKTALLLALGAVGCKLLHALLLNFSTWISHKAAYGTLKDIRDAVSGKLLRLPLGYFEENGSGRLKTMLVDHIENMEKTLAHMIPELTANLLGPALCMIWMVVIDWRLALIVLGWIILGFSVTGGMMKGYEEKFAGQIKAMKGMNQAITEYVGGIEVIKNFGRADECYKKYQDAVYGHASYNVNWMRQTQKYSSLGMAVAPFSLFPVLLAGLLFWSRGTLEAATLILMVLLTFGIFGPLMNAMNYFDQLAGMGVNAKEIKDVLDYPELKRGAGAAPTDSSIRFRAVSFTYPGADRPALDHVSLTVPQGTTLALVGPSGSGKSTIAKLIAGFWDAREGCIEIGGKPLSAYSQEQLNQMIAFVDQETFLFDDTIRNNIRLGAPAASDEEVEEMTRAAGCDAFIRALPQGYETTAGTAGSRLSGGEKQRIAIARAMMKRSPILILDEATASADPENEASIQKALSAAARGKTLVVVAHHLSTVVGAQQIAFVQNGRIEACGTHEQLMKTCPAYKSLWELQEVG